MKTDPAAPGRPRAAERTPAVDDNQAEVAGTVPAPCALPSVATARASSVVDLNERRRADPRPLIRQVRGDLDWIVMKAIEKDRTRRYAAASELAADINHHLVSEPVSAGRPTWAYRLAKFGRKHRRPLAVGNSACSDTG